MLMFNPAHPGELIRENIEGLREESVANLTLEEVAQSLGTTRQKLSALLNKRQSVTPEMAVRLAGAFRNTSAEFWLTVQHHYNLAQARQLRPPLNVRVLWEPAMS